MFNESVSSVNILMKNHLYILPILLLQIILLATSCEKPDVYNDSDLAQKLYNNSVDTLLIDSHKYFLETDLWRNLMPGGPIPTKRKLSALIFLVNADSTQITTNISLTKLYVIKGSLIWVSIPHDSNQTNVPDYKLDFLSTDGPEWETDILVDVVVEVFIKSINDNKLLKASQQKIEAVY